jgi:aminopeptidase-like protein
MRSKYNEYPEYHTSLDNLELITPEGLHGSFLVYQDCLEALEKNQTFRANCLCEPQLGRRNLYPTLSTKEAGLSVRNMMNFLAYSDGTNDLIAIADRIHTPVWELYDIAERLVREGLVTPC